eukprot:scaffold4841_cov121-Skeletonema_dohrnii-CCMP3373.AAC.8
MSGEQHLSTDVGHLRRMIRCRGNIEHGDADEYLRPAVADNRRACRMYDSLLCIIVACAQVVGEMLRTDKYHTGGTNPPKYPPTRGAGPPSPGQSSQENLSQRPDNGSWKKTC